MTTQKTAKKETAKKKVQVRDLKPAKDAKGGGGGKTSTGGSFGGSFTGKSTGPS